jgi:hypothetical protein
MAHTLQQQIITRALQLLADESMWASRAIARDAEGHPFSSCDLNAVRWGAFASGLRADR